MKKYAGYFAVGAAVVAVGVYVYKRSQAKKLQEVEAEAAVPGIVNAVERAMESEGEKLETEVKAEIPKIAKRVMLQAHKKQDTETRIGTFNRFLFSLNKEDRASFMTAYLFMKRELIKKYGIQFIGKRAYVRTLECLMYTIEKKLNKNHPERNILKESVDAVRDEFLLMMQTPSHEFFMEADIFASIFLKGEDMMKISDTVRKQATH